MIVAKKTTVAILHGHHLGFEMKLLTRSSSLSPLLAHPLDQRWSLQPVLEQNEVQVQACSAPVRQSLSLSCQLEQH